MKFVFAADLGNLITCLARDAVATQDTLDRGYEADLMLFAAMLERAPEELRAGPLCVAPARQIVRSFEIAVTVQLSRGDSTGFQIQALPIHMGYAIRFRTRTTELSRIRISVEQVPVSKGLPCPTPVS